MSIFWCDLLLPLVCTNVSSLCCHFNNMNENIVEVISWQQMFGSGLNLSSCNVNLSNEKRWKFTWTPFGYARMKVIVEQCHLSRILSYFNVMYELRLWTWVQGDECIVNEKDEKQNTEYSIWYLHQCILSGRQNVRREVGWGGQGGTHLSIGSVGRTASLTLTERCIWRDILRSASGGSTTPDRRDRHQRVPAAIGQRAPQTVCLQTHNHRYSSH